MQSIEMIIYKIKSVLLVLQVHYKTFLIITIIIIIIIKQIALIDFILIGKLNIC
jgi:hypothetical protein